MDKSSICILNMLEVEPSHTKCVREYILYPIVSAILNIYRWPNTSTTQCIVFRHVGTNVNHAPNVWNLFVLHKQFHDCSQCMDLVCLATILHTEAPNVWNLFVLPKHFDDRSQCIDHVCLALPRPR